MRGAWWWIRSAQEEVMLGLCLPGFFFSSPEIIWALSVGVTGLFLSSTLLDDPSRWGVRGGFVLLSTHRPRFAGEVSSECMARDGIYVQTDRKCTFALNHSKPFLSHAVLYGACSGCRELLSKKPWSGFQP
ncbi:uncharacterized protein B0H64DRAFT_401124 [Chaetomium fimeti]|uniref:Uncharacterized protein n=1 Tax=Chaetomium fimeti TaxID=1854472 RepID=A0AAE0LQY6_9PEZI|nr:hypothetical protein B0H64DRAFT_401124 [Chaetomium fimeti]